MGSSKKRKRNKGNNNNNQEKNNEEIDLTMINGYKCLPILKHIITSSDSDATSKDSSNNDHGKHCQRIGVRGRRPA